jgi:hypothetical protein
MQLSAATACSWSLAAGLQSGGREGVYVCQAVVTSVEKASNVAVRRLVLEDRHLSRSTHRDRFCTTRIF